MQVVALPQVALGVDGVHEELQHKLPVANTEGDYTGSVQDIARNSKLVVVCEIECIGHGYQVEEVVYNYRNIICGSVSIVYLILTFWREVAAHLILII